MDKETSCYICLEECEEEPPPCNGCSMPAHKSCLDAFRQKTPHSNCTICQTPYVNDIESLVPPNVMRSSQDAERACDCCSCSGIKQFAVHFAYLSWAFLCYLMAGWLGKCLQVIVFDIKVSGGFFEFWTSNHVMCAMFVMGIFIFLRLLYLRKRRI